MIDPTHCHPLYESGGSSRYYLSKEKALEAINNGCVLCHKTFVAPSEGLLDLWYETSDLYVNGLTILEVATIRIALMQAKSTTSRDVFLVDKKAAVCADCWLDYLKGVKEEASKHGVQS